LQAEDVLRKKLSLEELEKKVGELNEMKVVQRELIQKLEAKVLKQQNELEERLESVGKLI
jgi:hypothetical protein